jgi:RND family efflux transporter MFP subunit
MLLDMEVPSLTNHTSVASPIMLRVDIDDLRDDAGVLDRAAIKRILPYDDDFLFVGSVSLLTESEIVSHYRVPSDSALVNAHIVHSPTMPNVLVTEFLVQAGILLVHYSATFDTETDVLAHAIHKAKFKSPAVPGEVLRGHVTIQKMGSTSARLEGMVFVKDRRLFQAVFDVRFVARHKLIEYTKTQAMAYQPEGAPHQTHLVELRQTTMPEVTDIEQNPDALSEPLEGTIDVPASVSPPKRRRKPLGRWLLALLLAGGIGLGFLYSEQEPMTLSAVKLKRADLAYLIRVTGEVINDKSVYLTALVDGQIQEVHVGRGDQVKANQVLISMDNRAAAARKNRSEALVAQKLIRLREQEQRLDRFRRLAGKGGAASVETLEQAELEVAAAKASWEVTKAEAQVIAVEQDWQLLRAPFDAVVVEKTTESGQWVEAGTKLIQLVAVDGWEIEAHLDAIDSGRVSVGQLVSVRSPAFPGRSWKTRIHWIGPMVEREKGRHLNTFPVRMSLGEDSPQLLLGQQLDVEVTLEERQQVLRLPFAALREKGPGKFEVALIEKGVVRFQPVETGLETDTHVEILSGLEEGQAVVRLDGQTLKAGSAAQFASPHDSN